MMGLLYGERYEIVNVYYLVYLVDNVRVLALLWIYSCFYFEDKSGFLLKFVYGI